MADDTLAGTGRLLVVEGPDGSGKTTLVAQLADHLRRAGHVVHMMREPGGTGLSEVIRTLVKGTFRDPSAPESDSSPPLIGARAEALLFAAARAQLVDEVIRPTLARGEIVLLDRYRLSSAVYQGIGRGLGAAEINRLTDFAVPRLTPDLTICLQVSSGTAASRRAARSRREAEAPDRIESEGSEFLETVRRGYEQLAAEDASAVTISAEGDPNTVFHAALTQLRTLGL